VKSETPITDKHAFHRITGIASPDGDAVGSTVTRSLEKSANDLACYLEEYTKQVDESHEPLYWLACRALERFRKLKEQTVAATPNDER
jgi:hypothetical protein